MSDILKRMQKASFIEKAAVMSKSEFFNNRDLIPLPVPIMNVAWSGRLDGGFGAGMHLICGPSKHFKSNLALVLVKAFLDHKPDGIILFYDSEFGSLPEYWETAGIDTSRVLHLPIKNMEEFKFDVMKKLEDIKSGDNVMIYVDSLGNLASKKELDDALKESSAADMTRAKVGKGLARMITPYLVDLNIPMVAIQHTYECGTEDMHVMTPDRGAVSLKDLTVGDAVYTTHGIQEITYTTKHEDASVCEVELEDGTILEFTAGHRFMVNGQWRYIDELQPGDSLDSVKI